MTVSPFRLRLSHVTIPARDLERMTAFYRDVLGFLVTNRGEPVPGMGEMVFMSQTPEEHHQIVLVHTPEPTPPGFMFADHVAFRTGSLDDVRAIAARLVADGNTSGIPVSHGNAWSVYFTDPEGNGVECFVDTPYHVAQPFGEGLDLNASDDQIESTTHEKVSTKPEFMPFDQWRAEMEARLRGDSV